MQEQVLTIEGITPNMLWVFLFVAVGLGAVLLLVLNIWSKIREIRKPKNMNRKTIDDKLANDNQRIEKLEKDSRKTQDEMKLLLTGEMAMLHHMIDGNHTESLKESQSQIEYFLAYGKLPN